MSLPGGAQLTLLVGPTIPLPAPPQMIEVLDQVSVTHTDEGPSGFQITFRAGRGSTDLLDYSLLAGPLLRPCSRILLIVTFRGMPQVLMDGIITNQQLQPGREPGTSTLTITGEDVSVMMDLEEQSREHVGQPELAIVTMILKDYAPLLLTPPTIIPPPSVDVPLPTERIPVQQVTDRQYLVGMAQRFGYVFFITPGPAPTQNTAYWGPPPRLGVPQNPITVNMGPETNVIGDPGFEYDGLAPTQIEGQVQDRLTNQTFPVASLPVSTRIPLVTQPACLTQSSVSKRRYRHSGATVIQGLSEATGEFDASTDRTVRATGSLDALVYEGILKPRGVVGLRGVGYSYDGLYYVKSVTHQIRIGQYTQQFKLRREGLGAISPFLPVSPLG